MLDPKLLYLDANYKKQISKFVDDNGIEKERHEYNGPYGRGYVNILRKNGMIRVEHYGKDPAFQSHDWVMIQGDNLSGS